MKAVELKKQLALLNKVYEATNKQMWVSIGVVMDIVGSHGVEALSAMNVIAASPGGMGGCVWIKNKPTAAMAKEFAEKCDKLQHVMIYTTLQRAYDDINAFVNESAPSFVAMLKEMNIIYFNTATDKWIWGGETALTELTEKVINRVDKSLSESHNPKLITKKKTEAKPLKPQPHTTGALTRSMNLLNDLYNVIRQGDGSISAMDIKPIERFIAKQMLLIEYKDGKWHWLREKPNRETAIQFTHNVNQKRETAKAKAKAKYEEKKAADKLKAEAKAKRKKAKELKQSVKTKEEPKAIKISDVIKIREKEYNNAPSAAKGLLENLTANSKEGFKTEAQVKVIVDKVTQKMQGKIDIVEKARAELSDIIVKDGRKFKELETKHDKMQEAYNDLDRDYAELAAKDCEAEAKEARLNAIIVGEKKRFSEASSECNRLQKVTKLVIRDCEELAAKSCEVQPRQQIEKYKGIVIKLPTRAIQLILTALGSAAVTGIIIYYILNVISIAS